MQKNNTPSSSTRTEQPILGVRWMHGIHVEHLPVLTAGKSTATAKHTPRGVFVVCNGGLRPGRGRAGEARVSYLVGLCARSDGCGEALLSWRDANVLHLLEQLQRLLPFPSAPARFHLRGRTSSIFWTKRRTHTYGWTGRRCTHDRSVVDRRGSGRVGWWARGSTRVTKVKINRRQSSDRMEAGACA